MHPLDTCLSNFRQLFALGFSYYDYSFDLLDTGRYYAAFDRLIEHWQQVLPGRLLQVKYEALVDDQRGETARLLRHCGLEWDARCLDFDRNPDTVSTASAVQVRKPIYRSGRRPLASLRPPSWSRCALCCARKVSPLARNRAAGGGAVG